jgi:hypothetical protein
MMMPWIFLEGDAIISLAKNFGICPDYPEGCRKAEKGV